MIDPKIIKVAKKIAQKDLVSCGSLDGIVAGSHHFVDLWARDSLLSTYGLLEKKDFPIFRQTINTFLAYQRSDGLIPYRVMRSKTSIGKYFGRPRLLDRPSPNYYSHMSLGIVPDGGLMAVIASAEYVSRSKDYVWLASVYAALARSMDWYFRRFGNELISEWFQCEWADGVLKSGKTLYTNVLYVKALKDMVYLSKILGKKVEILMYSERSEAMHKKLHDEFWNGNYFVDWIDWKKQHYFASHQNFLAIIYGIATKNEALSILDYAKANCINIFTLHNVYPAYPFWRIPIIQAIGGIPQYHNRGILWLQPGITFALALQKVGKSADAKKFLTQIAQHIVKYKSVYEVYELNGSPVYRLMYKSEGPFAWSAGLFLWASHEIFGRER